MKIIRYSDADYGEASARLNRRAVPSDAMRAAVGEILAEVRARGDEALLEFGRRFDGVDLAEAGLRVSPQELDRAAGLVDEATREAVAASLANVRAFARRGLQVDWSMTNAEGARVGEMFHPLGRVGIYVPGGTAPLVSTALMTVPHAVEAGVAEVVVCTPPGPGGSVHPALLYALAQAGATEVYKVGGAQAVAAMAYGTDSVGAVQKVFGPGNAWVVEAKRQVYGVVGVDLLPGPSEVLVLADGTARAEWIAADMLAQAEHGKGSEVGLVTTSEELLQEVVLELEKQAALLGRRELLREVLESRTFLVLERSLDEAVRLVNAHAPEHLSLVVHDAEAVLGEIRTAGAIYVGGWSPVAAGDFVSGPSHELPTGGAGKAFPGLTTSMFQRRTSVVRYDRESVARVAGWVETFARVEGLDAHGRSVSLRAAEAGKEDGGEDSGVLLSTP